MAHGSLFGVFISIKNDFFTVLKINGKSCNTAGSDWQEPLNEGHIINKADCFMHYHPLIKEYIASRMK